jgi:glycosyltransferase involved in cell wall biosynthesis
MTNILFFGCGQIPLALNSPVDGAGFRTWQIFNGLKSKGHTVQLAIYSYDGTIFYKEKSLLFDSSFNFNSNTTQEELISKLKPEVIIYYYWPIINIKDHSCIKEIPICIDFAGPVLVEKYFQEGGLKIDTVINKIKNINNGDYFTCSGKRQYYYFSSFLLMSGMHEIIDDSIMGLLPLSADPKMIESPILEKTSFPTIKCIHCGYFHPWQNPTTGLNRIAEYIKKNSNIELDIYGIPSSMGVNDSSIQEKIGIHPKIHYLGCQNYSVVIDGIKKADLAIDLMSKSLERELSMNIRTLQFLSNGIPIIYNNYAEISPLISKYNAGWCIDPDNPEKIDKILDDIVADPNQLKEMGLNAKKLVYDNFNWEKTIDSLSNFCFNPKKREKNCLLINEFINSYPKKLINLIYE